MTTATRRRSSACPRRGTRRPSRDRLDSPCRPRHGGRARDRARKRDRPRGERLARRRRGALDGRARRRRRGDRRGRTASRWRSSAISSDRAQSTSLLDRAAAAFGPIDILVNNAGIGSSADPRPLAEFRDAFWDETLELNLTAPYLLSKAALPHMRAQRWGRIVTVASINGRVPSPFSGAYVASKHGVIGLMRTLALEVAAEGITVNCVCPGPVHTRVNDARIAFDARRLGRDDRGVRAGTDADRRPPRAGGHRADGRLPRGRRRAHDHRTGVQRRRRGQHGMTQSRRRHGRSARARLGDRHAPARRRLAGGGGRPRSGRDGGRRHGHRLPADGRLRPRSGGARRWPPSSTSTARSTCWSTTPASPAIARSSTSPGRTGPPSWT